MLVRPHPPREEEEKIVVAVLRATCRSMMMTVLYNKGFRFVDGRRRRHTTTTTQTNGDFTDGTTTSKGPPTPLFLFLGFYETLNFRHPLVRKVLVFFCCGRGRDLHRLHILFIGAEERYYAMTLSFSLSRAARVFSIELEPRFSRRSLCERAREGGCAGVRRSRVGPPVGASFFFRSSRGVFGALSLSFSLLDEGKRKCLGGEMMSRTARGRAHATVETRERGRRRVDECVGNDENRSSSVFARRREEKKARRATRDDASPSFCWGFLLEGLSFFRLVNACLRLAYSPLSRLVLSSSRIKQNDYSANMGRMHSKGKGMSKSSIPYKRSAPLWCKTSPDEIKDMIAKMAKKGMTPSQIGVILRDNHGIPQVSTVTNSKIMRILKGQGLAPTLPEDLYCLIKKAVSVRKHLERNRKDMDSKFRLILIESRIHRLARYYRLAKKLEPNWRYESSTASTLLTK